MEANNPKLRVSLNVGLVALLLVELYALIYDVWGLQSIFDNKSNLVMQAGHPIVTIVDIQNRVKIRKMGSPIWNEAKNGDEIFQKQSIQTVENSRATVSLSNRTELFLNEKTEIEIDEGKVNLIRGIIRTLSSAHPVEIELPEINAKVPANSEAVFLVSGNQTRIWVENGEIQIRHQNSSLVAKSGYEISLMKGALQLDARQNPFVLRNPGYREIQFLNPQIGSVEFQWKINPEQIPESPLELEVSPDANFKENVSRKLIASTTPALKEAQTAMQLQVPKKRTNWFWRVRAVAGGSSSNVHEFITQSPPIPTLLYPVQNMQIHKDKYVDFAWEEAKEINAYAYELKLKNEDGQQLQLLKTQERHISIEPLAAGKYKWQIRAIHNLDQRSEWTSELEFVVIPNNS